MRLGRFLLERLRAVTSVYSSNDSMTMRSTPSVPLTVQASAGDTLQLEHGRPQLPAFKHRTARTSGRSQEYNNMRKKARWKSPKL